MNIRMDAVVRHSSRGLSRSLRPNFRRLNIRRLFSSSFCLCATAISFMFSTRQAELVDAPLAFSTVFLQEPKIDSVVYCSEALASFIFPLPRRYRLPACLRLREVRAKTSTH